MAEGGFDISPEEFQKQQDQQRQMQAMGGGEMDPWSASQIISNLAKGPIDQSRMVNPLDYSADWGNRQYSWANGSNPATGDPWWKATGIGGESQVPGQGVDKIPREGGWLDHNLVGILAAILTGGAAAEAMGGGAALGEAAGTAAGEGAGAALGGAAGAGELGGGGMLLDTGGMGLTGAGGIGSVPSLADAGIAGWGSGAGAAAGAGAGLGAHFSDAGYAAQQNALNPSLGLDSEYVGSGTGSGWDAGVSGGNPDYSNEGHNYPTSESTQGIGGSPINATTAGTPGLGLPSGIQNRLISQLLQTALKPKPNGAGGGSGLGGMFGAGGTGYTPNEMANETPGMMGTAAAPQSQQQASASHFLGGAQQPQLQGVGYMQVPQAQDPSQMMKLAQALQGQDQNYG